MRPKELPQFPAIKDGDGNEVTDFEGTVKALRRVLFPPSPPADLTDVEGADCLEGSKRRDLAPGGE